MVGRVGYLLLGVAGSGNLVACPERQGAALLAGSKISYLNWSNWKWYTQLCVSHLEIVVPLFPPTVLRIQSCLLPGSFSLVMFE